MEESQPIAQVRNMRSGINTKGVVKSMGDPRTVNLKSGGTIDVCDAVDDGRNHLNDDEVNHIINISEKLVEEYVRELESSPDN